MAWDDTTENDAISRLKCHIIFKEKLSVRKPFTCETNNSVFVCGGKSHGPHAVYGDGCWDITELIKAHTHTADAAHCR